MIQSTSYRNAFYIALGLHILIAILLLVESSTTRPVLVAATKTELGRPQPQTLEHQEQAIQAVSVDSTEVMKTVQRLKDERLKQQQAEQNRQQNLAKMAMLARQQRIAEQQRLEKIKVEEKQRLKALAQQKALEEKRLAEMKSQQVKLKQQQQQEALKLAALQKKKEEAIQQEMLAQKAKDAEVLVKKQQAAAEQAALNAENTRIAGEVDKYKALIINAISQQWILPENVDRHLSSQFRIRLAPDGVVLEVSLIRSSGDPILDRSAQSAIYKASPLPVPRDPSTFNLFRDISLTVRPENVRG